MYKNEFENVEVYFICDKRKDMGLVDVYYDEINDIHNWYINAYLSYLHWQNRFRNFPIGDLTKGILTVAASRYLLYVINNKLYQNDKEYQSYLKELKKIEKSLSKIVSENEILLHL